MKQLSQHLNQIAGKRVIIRCNYDVPLENGQVLDTTRIEDSFSTIKVLREVNCPVILIAHAGRPEGAYNQEFSLKPILPIIEKGIGEKISFIDYAAFNQEQALPEAMIFLLENLRFWPEEELAEEKFAQKLAKMADVYVNESFATSHREHASITKIPELIPGYAGLNLAKEVDLILSVKQQPKRPLVLVMGGAKLETKIPLIEAFLPLADQILVGGKLALDLQTHHLQSNPKITVASLVESGKDITLDSAQSFATVINQAGTVIWNGSMGVFEEPEYQQGTKIVAQAVNHTPAFTLAGGGDTESALTVLNLESGIDHISTGGGAMLDLLVHNTLPGLKVL
jgi:phosphoglycerate kinase